MEFPSLIELFIQICKCTDCCFNSSKPDKSKTKASSTFPQRDFYFLNLTILSKKLPQLIMSDLEWEVHNIQSLFIDILVVFRVFNFTIRYSFIFLFLFFFILFLLLYISLCLSLFLLLILSGMLQT